MAQRRCSRPVCLYSGALGMNVRICREEQSESDERRAGSGEATTPGALSCDAASDKRPRAGRHHGTLAEPAQVRLDLTPGCRPLLCAELYFQSADEWGRFHHFARFADAVDPQGRLDGVDRHMAEAGIGERPLQPGGVTKPVQPRRIRVVGAQPAVTAEDVAGDTEERGPLP